MAKVVQEWCLGLMSDWKVLQIITEIYRKNKGVQEGTFVRGGGIEIRCIHFLYEAKIYEINAWEKIKQ